MRQSSGGALVAEYLYDANGRRVVKSVNGGIFERYIYADLETISVLDGSQAWKQDFVFDVTGIDQILMLEQADVLDQDSDLNTTELTRSYYHRNALGSVMEISTASQTEAASFRYTPYGEVTITRGGAGQTNDPLGQRIGFAGRLRDAESHLCQLRSRDVDPTSGKFIQRDPLGYSAGANLTEYGLSAPQTVTDPLGLSPEPLADLQIRMSNPVFVSPTPLDRLSNALVSQAVLDEWISTGWRDGRLPTTWLQRYRDPILMARLKFRVEIEVDCGAYGMVPPADAGECKCYVSVWGTFYWRANFDRNALRGRQDFVYGEFLRGPRTNYSGYEQSMPPTVVMICSTRIKKPGGRVPPVLREPEDPIPPPPGGGGGGGGRSRGGVTTEPGDSPPRDGRGNGNVTRARECPMDLN